MMSSIPRDGGYDAGYSACPCFWGRTPGSLVLHLLKGIAVDGWRILDAGCGEGKNAAYLASLGAEVLAVELSEPALQNAELAWPDISGINWIRRDIRDLSFAEEEFDLVIAYGLLHCLSSSQEIAEMIRRFHHWTKPAGYNVICAFNDRKQDLFAHPGFHPTLLKHEQYVSLYNPWDLSALTDTDLQEVHPHNDILHSHSMTRFIAQKPIAQKEG
jgi:cyclopropane fatty-acyl-phospholipid synthase-like methyltransferase